MVTTNPSSDPEESKPPDQSEQSEPRERASPSERPDDVPVWEDEYLDSVGLRLMYHYDLECDRVVEGERFPLYGELHVRHERHAFHPALTFAEHEVHEYVFATQIDTPRVSDVERLEELGEQLAATWVDADEDHYSTDFSFVIVAQTCPETVAEYVENYKNRNLLKGGYFGHYEINLVVVVPDDELSVASTGADVEQAFRVWEPIIKEEPGRLDRFLGWLSR